MFTILFTIQQELLSGSHRKENKVWCSGMPFPCLLLASLIRLMLTFDSPYRHRLTFISSNMRTQSLSLAGLSRRWRSSKVTAVSALPWRTVNWRSRVLMVVIDGSGNPASRKKLYCFRDILARKERAFRTVSSSHGQGRALFTSKSIWNKHDNETLQWKLTVDQPTVK